MRADCEYRFSFVNFSKPDSQYSVGMKPVLYSEMEAQQSGVGWMRVGSEMTYFKDCRSSDDPDRPSQYVMSFTLTFPHANDTVYLAHCYPYKYTDLIQDLNNIRNDHQRSKCFKQTVLCQTLAGNDVPLVTITSPNTAADMKYKQAVIITARVHPGESPSSWIMKGILHFLTSDTEAAESLRKLFVFKIVPMLNPDGVIVGNTRCNLAGADLNRQYKHCVKEAFPSVFFVKEMIAKLIEDNVRIILYCDLHAHSRKYNMFMYGCENRKKSHKYLKEQIFPFMLHKNAKDRFNFEDCRFTVTRDKEGTGRIVFKNMGILNSFTLEASYGGSNVGNKAYSHFTPRDYENVGRYFCETLLDFNDPSPPKEQLRYKILLRLLRDKSSATEPSNVAMSGYSSISSSECDYTEEDEEKAYDDNFLFQNVKKTLRRKLRKKPFKPSIFCTKAGSEDSKPTDEFSSSSSSSESECNEAYLHEGARHSIDSNLTEKLSDYLSDISQDEDAINVDMMRDFRYSGAASRDSFEGNNSTIEFSASACQRIHSELLASVNQIYVNLQDSGLKTTSSSSSSLSAGNKLKMQKTSSVELKPDSKEKLRPRETRSSSITEINLKKKLLDEEFNRTEKSPLASNKQKQKQKKFASAAKIEVIVKSKSKLKNTKKLKDREP